MTKTILAAAAAAALLAPATAAAHRTDGDGMPARWEQRHGLDHHADDARKDPDHDGLRNLREYREHTHPRRADSDSDGLRDRDELRTAHDPRDDDSDDDGTEDGEETVGTVTSFDGTTLVITMPDGSSVSGAVTDATEIECEDGEDAPVASASSDDDENRSEDEDRADDEDRSDEDAEEQGDHEEDAEDAETDDGDSCDAAQLVPGALVHEAELSSSTEGLVYTEVELVR